MAVSATRAAIGRSPTGSIGFGAVSDSGRIRVPRPAARTMTSMADESARRGFSMRRLRRPYYAYTQVMASLDDHRARRTRTARFYAAELPDGSHVQHLSPIGGLSAVQHVRYPIVLRTAALRDRVREALAEAGIQATTLYDWPVIDAEEFPGAGRLQRGIPTLPTHPYVDDRDRRQVVETGRETVASVSPNSEQTLDR
jgi:hypothetical protein